jgi:hypothetical protein
MPMGAVTPCGVLVLSPSTGWDRGNRLIVRNLASRTAYVCLKLVGTSSLATLGIGGARSPFAEQRSSTTCTKSEV